ncbi:hypothetical protein J7426_22355 [Tropicibacter sp. R16_0]|uniref:hypothetical protein n=1 Tax=Tropicibacter sp. R16_0 TaxID=2821102 RepID=UPI001ADB5AD5|nr:hypothetical protein [Tropicibacter sp. R16_0]MBO9453022.1 hypothetical protein [Tropicibacter sp. R16_0]
MKFEIGLSVRSYNGDKKAPFFYDQDSGFDKMSLGRVRFVQKKTPAVLASYWLRALSRSVLGFPLPLEQAQQLPKWLNSVE